MPTPTKGPRLGGSPQHHNMMMANLATELFRHGRIKTTKAKAKKVQPLAERMVTFARRGDLHSRRQVLKVIRDKDVVHKLFADIGPAAADRNGGYTRVLPLGPRKGDNAEMALIELVDVVETESGEDALTEAPTRRWSLRRRRGTISRSAREREEAIAAAEDKGADSYEVPADADDSAGDSAEDDAVEAGRITERTLAKADAKDETTDEDEGPAPDVTPEAVAARLGDAEDADADADDDADVETSDDDEAAEAADDEEE